MGQNGMDPVAMQMNIRNNTMEMQECIKDLYKWETEMHKKEEQLKKSRAAQACAEQAPIRGKAPVVRQSNDPELSKPVDALRHGSDKSKKQAKTPLGASKTAAAHTYDYFKDRWDKFDVDAALAEVDEPGKSVKQPLEEIAHARNDNAQEAPVRAPRSTEEERDMWKNKGNEYFKFGDFNKAKECYSSSLAAKESDAAYTNRALACIRLKEWQQAEEDCTKVIANDPQNLKAWQRRAEARKGRGNALGYIQDLDAALRLAPQSSAISSQLRQALPKHLSSKGLSMPSTRAPVHVEAELNDPEPPQAPEQQENLAPATHADEPTVTTAEAHAPNVGTSACSAGTSMPEVSAHAKIPDGTAQADPARQQAAESSMSVPAQADAGSPAGKAEGRSRPSSASGSVAIMNMNLPSIGISVPSVAPTTSADFECHWRATKGNQDARQTYLDLIDPPAIVALFGSALTPDVLEGVVRTLLSAVRTDTCDEKAARRVQLLGELPRVQRFSMNLMLVSRGAKKELAGLWDDCIRETCADSVKEKLTALKKVYKL